LVLLSSLKDGILPPRRIRLNNRITLGLAAADPGIAGPAAAYDGQPGTVTKFDRPIGNVAAKPVPTPVGK
jgi:hypothetical protein